MDNKLIEQSRKNFRLNKVGEKINKKIMTDNLRDLGFSVLIPTFDYECTYTNLILDVGSKIAKIRNRQKYQDKKKLKSIFKNCSFLPEELKARYEIFSMSAGAFYAEKFYKTITTKSYYLEQLHDYRVLELLASYDLSSKDSVKAEQEAKRLLMDIVQERVLFDLIATNGQTQMYDMCLNNIHDTRLPDAFSTYGLMQLTGTFFDSNGIYLKISVNGVSIEEEFFNQTKSIECNIEEYYKKYMANHNQTMEPNCFRTTRVLGKKDC